MEMTETRALGELKLLDKRINDGIGRIGAIELLVDGKIVNGRVTPEEFSERAKSSLQSVQDLIKRRSAIKEALVTANAQTMVTIAGQPMTVAAAIERKSGIAYEKALLAHLRNRNTFAQQRLEKMKSEVQSRLDTLLNQHFGGKDSKVSKDDQEAISAPFLKRNEPNLLDPLRIADTIDALQREIDAFETEVDWVLTESNAKTTITILD
jgi:hypothetical protein